MRQLSRIAALLVVASTGLPQLASGHFTGNGNINEPTALAFDGTHVWVISYGNSSLVELNAADGSYVRSLPTASPSDIVFDGENIWVSNWYYNTITRFKASDGSPNGHWYMGPGSSPSSLVFDGAHIWFSSVYATGVTELNASDGSLVRVVPLASQPGPLVFDGQRIWTIVSPGTSSQLVAINASNGSMAGTFHINPTGGALVSLAFDGANIWLSNVADNSVAKYRASDGSRVGTYGGGGDIRHPRALAFDGSHLWVANADSPNGTTFGSVTELNASDGTKVATFKTDISYPDGLLFDGAYIWVSNIGTNSVTRIPVQCPSGPTAVCLNGGRFRLTAEFDAGSAGSGDAHAVKLTADTGYLWFFSDANVEVVVKVLDQCGYNNHFWVFAGGLTNVHVAFTVTDTQTGRSKTYVNPQGTKFAPIQDTLAFATCP